MTQEVSNFVIENGVLKKYNGTDENVIIPEEVTAIGHSAFSRCESLASVVIHAGVVSVGSFVFFGCKNLKIILCEAAEKPAAWESTWLGDCTAEVEWDFIEKAEARRRAEAAETLGKLGYKTKRPVPVPDGTADDLAKKKRDKVFSIIKFSVVLFQVIVFLCVTFGFRGCGVANKEDAPPESMFVIENGVLIEYSGDDWEVTIPEGVTSIGEEAFYGNTFVQSITIPEGVTHIGMYAFQYCTSLTSVTMPDSLISIGGTAFASCEALESIDIPASVELMGAYAFTNCTSLQTIYCKSTEKPVGWSENWLGECEAEVFWSYTNPI